MDLKLTPYKVVSTGSREGFLQFVDALPISSILSKNEYKSIRDYLRINNPSETDKYGISLTAMNNYVRSSGNLEFRFFEKDVTNLSYLFN